MDVVVAHLECAFCFQVTPPLPSPRHSKRCRCLCDSRQLPARICQKPANLHARQGAKSACSRPTSTPASSPRQGKPLVLDFHEARAYDNSGAVLRGSMHRAAFSTGTSLCLRVQRAAEQQPHTLEVSAPAAPTFGPRPPGWLC